MRPVLPSVAAAGNFRVLSILRAAGRRRLRTLALDQLGVATAIVLAGAILLLILGTEAVPPYWLVILAGIALSISAYQLHARRLSAYQIAQILDRRLQLQDSLSTAWYLLAQQDLESTPASAFQVDRAEQIASGIDPGRAFPFVGWRSWQVAGALAIAVLGLFTLRYLVTRSLSLQHTIMPFEFADVVERVENSLDSNSFGLKRPSAGGQGAPEAVPGAQGRKIAQTPNPAALQPQKSGGDEGSSTNPAGKEESKSQQANGQRGSNSSQSADSRSGQNASQRSPDQNGAKQTPSKEDQQNGTAKASGLVDRMKDALSSLMAKLRPNADGQRSSQQNQSQAQKAGDEATAGKGQNENSQQGARNEQSGQQESAEGAAEGATAEKSRTSGRSSTESADRKTDSAQSGVGHQNGDKDIKDAEQLKAMGKLAEIIGKRSANLTGDVTIETSSGNQQLKTQYSGRVGQHADLGGEINRDQIPIAYRDYVREYMDLVRKQADKTQH